MFAPIESSLEQAPTDIDDPVTRALYDHWLERANGRWAPAWSDIDIMVLDAKLLPYITVVDLTPDGDFTYRYWGRGHTAYHGVDYTRRRLSKVRPAWIRDFLFHQYMRVVETKKPLLFDTRYEHIEQANYSLRLPLSNDGEQLTSILGLANRRDVTAPMRHWVDKQRSTKP